MDSISKPLLNKNKLNSIHSLMVYLKFNLMNQRTTIKPLEALFFIPTRTDIKFCWSFYSLHKSFIFIVLEKAAQSTKQKSLKLFAINFSHEFWIHPLLLRKSIFNAHINPLSCSNFTYETFICCELWKYQ